MKNGTSRSSSVSTETRLRVGWPGFDSLQGNDDILFSPPPRPGRLLEPTQPLIQWVPGVLTPR